MIYNTREEKAGRLGLADMFVLSDFLYQKWLAYGFQYAYARIREGGHANSAEIKLIELVRAS